MEDARRSPSDTFNHVALAKGRYEYCFSNAFSTVTDKTLSFNVIVVKAYVEDTSKRFNEVGGLQHMLVVRVLRRPLAY